MITKYDVGQTVLIKGCVKGLRISDEDNKLHYFIKLNGERAYSMQEYVDTYEDEIVCGWIGENVGGGSSDR